MKRPDTRTAFQPARGPQIPPASRRVDLSTSTAAPAPAPGCKICLSIDVDGSLGHISRESYGDRLLVDKVQARNLAAVLLDYAGEPTATQLVAMPSEVALKKLSEQLQSFLSNDHCSEQTPPAERAQ